MPSLPYLISGTSLPAPLLPWKAQNIPAARQLTDRAAPELSPSNCETRRCPLFPPAKIPARRKLPALRPARALLQPCRYYREKIFHPCHTQSPPSDRLTLRSLHSPASPHIRFQIRGPSFVPRFRRSFPTDQIPPSVPLRPAY